MKNAKTKTTGPVALVTAYLNRNTDRIKAGRLSRMDAIRAMEEKGVKGATAAGTILKWSRTNDVQFVKKASA